MNKKTILTILITILLAITIPNILASSCSNSLGAEYSCTALEGVGRICMGKSDLLTNSDFLEQRQRLCSNDQVCCKLDPLYGFKKSGSCPINSQDRGEVCDCNDGYVTGTGTQRGMCIPDPDIQPQKTCPANSELHTYNKCYCKTGYIVSGTSCILDTNLQDMMNKCVDQDMTYCPTHGAKKCQDGSLQECQKIGLLGVTGPTCWKTIGCSTGQECDLSSTSCQIRVVNRDNDIRLWNEIYLFQTSYGSRTPDDLAQSMTKEELSTYTTKAQYYSQESSRLTTTYGNNLVTGKQLDPAVVRALHERFSSAFDLKDMIGKAATAVVNGIDDAANALGEGLSNAGAVLSDTGQLIANAFAGPSLATRINNGALGQLCRKKYGK